MFDQTYRQIATQGVDYGQLRLGVESYVDEVEDFDIDAIVEEIASAAYSLAIRGDAELLDVLEAEGEDPIQVDEIVARHCTLADGQPTAEEDLHDAALLAADARQRAVAIQHGVDPEYARQCLSLDGWETDGGITYQTDPNQDWCGQCWSNDILTIHAGGDVVDASRIPGLYDAIAAQVADRDA